MLDRSKNIPPGPVFTGERFIPGQSDPILALEHYHRYLFAAQFVNGKRVLDIACGEGYGAAFLAGTASSVLGIDRDEQTITLAKQTYAGRKNLGFQRGYCENFEAPPGTFDVVVSFETLEHLAEAQQTEFLRNVQKVLAPDGILLLSTPEPEEYARSRTGPNEFHVKELRRSELEELLGRYFPKVRFLIQRPVTVSLIGDGIFGKAKAAVLHMRRSLDPDSKSPADILEPKFVLAVCSKNQLPISLGATGESLYYDAGEVERMDQLTKWASGLQQEYDERTRWALQLDALVKEKEAYIANLQREFDERTQWALSLEQERQLLEQKSRELLVLQDLLEKRLATITRSLLYRVLAKLGLMPK